MKKNVKNRKPNSRLKSKRYSKKKVKQPQILGIGPKIINSILIGLNEGDFIHVRKIVDGLDEYELASLIESLSLHDRQKLVEVLGDRINPEVFPELNEVVQEQIIESLDENQIVHIVNELNSDEAVEILEHMDDDEQKSIINQLSPELKYQVQSSLSYPEDSAGRIMVREFVSMPDNWTVKEARQYLLSDEKLPEEFYTIFLTDEKMRPTGEIALDKLLRAKANEKLSDIMDGEIVPLSVDTDQEEVAHMFREYGWMSAEVVDAKGRLIGVINIDDVVDIIHEEASEDIMLLSGAEEGDVYKSPFSIFKSRSVWLVTNLFATILASTVVKGLMPIVASMGGTTGNQTLAVVVRALATKELTSRNTARMILKEFLVGLMNGMLFAGMIAAITWFLFHDEKICLIIALAMLCNLTLASLAGILIPLILNRFKADPAISSGGYFVFLGLAKLLLF